MTAADIRKRLRFWKKELNLQDWRFRLKCVPQEKISSHAYAEVYPSADSASAVIWINPDAKYAEWMLVHELGHCVLAGLSRLEHHDQIEERAINRYTYALCKAYSIPCPPPGEI